MRKVVQQTAMLSLSSVMCSIIAFDFNSSLSMGFVLIGIIIAGISKKIDRKHGIGIWD